MLLGETVGPKWLWDTSERLVSLPGTTIHSTIWDRKERSRPTQADSPAPSAPVARLNPGRTELAR